MHDSIAYQSINLALNFFPTNSALDLGCARIVAGVIYVPRK